MTFTISLHLSIMVAVLSMPVLLLNDLVELYLFAIFRLVMVAISIPNTEHSTFSVYPMSYLSPKRTPQYNMTEDNLRAKFEQYGEIKTFFSLIEKRGMLFVTYVSVDSTQPQDLGHNPLNQNYLSLAARLSLISELQSRQSSPCKTPI
jgi:RNA recognition motif-containing protein